MEDVHSAALKAMNAIVEDLKVKNIALSDLQYEEIYAEIDRALDEISNGAYRHHH